MAALLGMAVAVLLGLLSGGVGIAGMDLLRISVVGVDAAESSSSFSSFHPSPPHQFFAKNKRNNHSFMNNNNPRQLSTPSQSSSSSSTIESMLEDELERTDSLLDEAQIDWDAIKRESSSSSNRNEYYNARFGGGGGGSSGGDESESEPELQQLPRPREPANEDAKSSYYNSNNNRENEDTANNNNNNNKMALGAARKEDLYEAYNQLHVLAQEYNKPFDAPAVVVVGHQSSGKSALIEALMGFQFNQVGGGTKTRRPVALRMQYNPNCRQPRWYLVGEDGIERPMALSEIQDYIEQENKRLERDPVRSFDSREIHLRMEYRHCPNMILIDTPGLIAAPRIPKQRSGGTSAALAQQRALAAAAKEAERLVVDKMRCEDYIILCVEETSDWKHGSTREIVQKADPDLSRTVIVNTKFDTKIPQFGSPNDVSDFLKAPVLDQISPHRLGGPYFTSVPSGRVGRSPSSSDLSASSSATMMSDNYMFHTDEDFVHACADAEHSDTAIVLQRLKRMTTATTNSQKKNNPSNHHPHNNSPLVTLTSRIGLNKLRSFLEQHVDECYRRNVRKIIPMLQSEYEAAERRLQSCEQEIEALSVNRLKAGAEAFCDEFCVCLRKAIQGSIMAPVNLFGETLRQETASAGSFHDVQGCPMAVSDRTWDRLLERELNNQNHRLYGGSQYHRTLREFQLACQCLRLPSISDDEIANAAGLGDTHDGVNFLHAACTIALEKARVSFDPMLRALQNRMKHVMDRLCPVTEYMLRESRDRNKLSMGGGSGGGGFDYASGLSMGSTLSSSTTSTSSSSSSSSLDPSMDISQNPQFRQLVRSIFDKFVQQCSESAMSKSQDDLIAITRYVTWSLNERGSSALSRALPDQTDMIAVYQVALRSSSKQSNHHMDSSSSSHHPEMSSSSSKALTPMMEDNRNKNRLVEQDYRNLLQLVEETVVTRDTNRTNVVVTSLVQHIVSNWREQFCKSVTTKYNCYYMLPFVDQFHRFLRSEFQKMYEGEEHDLTEVFDLAAVRRNLQKHREDLINECNANKRIQDKFRMCSQQIRPSISSSSSHNE